MMHGAMAVFLQVILLKGASASDVKITVPAAWMDHMAEFRIELDYTLIKQVYYQLKMVYISSRQMVCMFPVIIQKLNKLQDEHEIKQRVIDKHTDNFKSWRST